MASPQPLTIVSPQHILQHHLSQAPNSAIAAQAKSLTDFIKTQANGEEFLQILSQAPAPIPLGPAGGGVLSNSLFSGLKKSVPASGSILWVAIWGSVQIKVGNFNRIFDGKAWGLGLGLPGGFMAGTLSYDDDLDFSGTYDIDIGSTVSYVYVNFYRNGNLKMSFQAGLVGFNFGGLTGSGSWT